LIPYARNARTHTDAQVAAIAASIKEWGWTTPALVGEDGGLIAGHARVLAARQLGIAEIPVMVAAGWTEAQKDDRLFRQLCVHCAVCHDRALA
jgi:ParB-like chromosome segregation protein Spo0J